MTYDRRPERRSPFGVTTPETDPTAANPTASDPVGIDPAVDSADGDPVATDPTGVDPAAADPTDIDPADIDDTTVEALGKLSEALETTERAKGHLYSFHQLTGHADLQLDHVVELLRASGHLELADIVNDELIGRNVLPGRWTFQIVEEYEDCYYRFFTDLEKRIRDQLAGGRRHLHEARMRERRQS
jgi:enamine deaminase RidA (YjgF/YER057c/UK114 family)